MPSSEIIFSMALIDLLDMSEEKKQWRYQNCM